MSRTEGAKDKGSRKKRYSGGKVREDSIFRPTEEHFNHLDSVVDLSSSEPRYEMQEGRKSLRQKFPELTTEQSHKVMKAFKEKTKEEGLSSFADRRRGNPNV